MSIMRRGARWTGLLLGATLAVAGVGCGGGGDGPVGPGGGGGPVVSSIDMTPGSASVVAGQTSSFTAQPKDATGAVITGQTLAWSTSDPSVATVAGGVVTAVKAGSATITAAVGAVKGTAALTVMPAVASVALNPNPANIVIGQTAQVTATLKDAGGATITDRAVTWSSSNDLVASVSSSGLVTSKGLGSATVTATVEGKAGTASVVVSPIPVASVAVSPASPNMTVGGTVQLNAETKDANGGVLTGRAIVWASSNETIATVTADGIVTAKAAGSATITATTEGKSGTSSITVTLAAVQTVAISPSAVGVLPGQTVQLTATVSDAAGHALTGRTVTWTTSDATKATVDATGLVTGVAYGTVTIQATSELKSGSAAVKVNDVTAPVMDALRFSISPVDVSSGAQTLVITAHLVDAGGSGVSQFAVNATAPSTQQYLTCPGGTRTSGTAADGTWTCAITFPAGAEPGDWKLLILVSDAATNLQTYTAAELRAASLPTVISVVNSNPDLVAPTFRSISVTPDPVDLSTGAKEITVSAHITDDVSGVASFDFVGTSPSGQTVSCIATTAAGVTDLDDSWSCRVTIPATAEAGTWKIYVKATDRTLKFSFLPRSDGFPAGMKSSFAVTH